jgi:hypothetical protein
MEVNSSARSFNQNQKFDTENSHIGHRKKSHLINKPLKAGQLIDNQMIHLLNDRMNTSKEQNNSKRKTNAQKPFVKMSSKIKITNPKNKNSEHPHKSRTREYRSPNQFHTIQTEESREDKKHIIANKMADSLCRLKTCTGNMKCICSDCTSKHIRRVTYDKANLLNAKTKD